MVLEFTAGAVVFYLLIVCDVCLHRATPTTGVVLKGDSFCLLAYLAVVAWGNLSGQEVQRQWLWMARMSEPITHARKNLCEGVQHAGKWPMHTHPSQPTFPCNCTVETRVELSHRECNHV